MSDFDSESEGTALSEWLEGEDEYNDELTEIRRRVRRKSMAKKRPARVAAKSKPVKITEPGIYDMGEREYHADPIDGGSLSQSGAKLLLKSPAKFAYYREHPSPSTRSMNLGTAAHAMVLGAGAEIVTVPEDLLSADGGVRSKEAREWKTAAIAAGKTVVSVDELATITAMADQLQQHPIAGPILVGEGKAEQAMFWRDEATNIWRRGMVDWTTTYRDYPTLVDYKTTTDVSPGAFARSVLTYGYHQQDDWYRDGWAALHGVEPEFLIVAQETTAPYLVAVHQLDAYAQMAGRTLNRRAIDLYARCTKTNTWPGYDEDVILLALPPWAEHEYEMEVA